MRTTLDLPDETIRQIKAQAAPTSTEAQFTALSLSAALPHRLWTFCTFHRRSGEPFVMRLSINAII